MTESLIDPLLLMRIQSLELRAKRVVQGFLSGLNRSPKHGFSVEFSEYRQYAAGDDVRFLDWRLFARSDRYFIKQFEDETNLRCTIALDSSRSMLYGSTGYTKDAYARTLAATLAFYLTQQRDAVGLATFDADLLELIPPRYRPGHLRRLFSVLERPGAGRATNLTKPIESLCERVSQQGMTVLITDGLAPLEGWRDSLARLAHRRQDLLLLQVLDPTEIDFPSTAPALFEDMESGRQVYVDPAVARDDYLSRFASHQAQIRAICEELGVDHAVLRTDASPADGLTALLRRRNRDRSRLRSSTRG